ncbi:MAG: HYR domain-containing protein [Flavobacteriaceae bacterium]
MKKITLTFLLIMTAVFAQAQTVFINEIHYDNNGGDVNEGVEIAGPAGTDLSGWSLVPYNGSNGQQYSVTPLSGSIDDEGSGYGAVFFAIVGLQNGAPDGIALVDDLGTVIQFLSYEGTFAATNGPANGLNATDIGVSEVGTTPIGESLQLIGTGNIYTDFSWTGPVAESPGSINVGQTFTGGGTGNPPIISCPANIVLDNIAGQCDAIANYAGTAIDIEDGDLSSSIVYTPASGSFFPVGTTTVTASVTDSDGNTSTCTFDVTVNDVENPVATCSDITVDLDATGNVTVFPGDVATVTDNCPGTTLQFQGIGGPSGAITTLFNSNNGGANGWTVMYDLTVGASDIEITGFDMNTSSTSAFNLQVYTLVGTFVGNQTNPGAWTLTATGSGTGAGTNNPSNVTLVSPMTLSAGTTYGIGLRMVEAGPQYSGTGTNPAPGSTSYSNADLSLSLGSAVSGLFTGSVFTPRIWNGTIYYGSPAPPVPSLDFTCMEVGPNNVTVIATDAAGNTSTCTAVVTVEDNIAPVIVCAGEASGPSVFINEIHYDNTGADQDEAIEIAGPAGTDLSTYSLVLYNGNNGQEYDNLTLSGTIDDEGNGFGAVNFPISGIQNGSPDGIVLANNGTIIQFLSYEGSFIAVDGIAAGLTSTDIGVSEPGNTPIGESLQLSGSGTYYPDFTWIGPTASSPGDINSGQTYIPPTSSVFDVILDGTTGTVTVDLNDLLLSVDEACSYTVTTGGGAPVPGTITTLFDSNNGGSNGGAIYFDLTVGPQDITLNDLDINTDEPGAFTMDIYTLVGTYVGNTGNAGAWTLATSSSGTASGTLNVPSNAVLDTPLVLTANTTYGMALVLDASHGHSYSGTGSDPSPGSTNYSNADLTLDLGAATNVPFDGSPFSPRIFNGTLNYVTGEPVATEVTFDCSQLGENQVEITVTDASGNSSTCTATVNVIDNTDPILVCMDATVSLDENGMASITPDLFIDTANSFDACGITITAVDVTDVTCDDIGTPITVTVFASDASGNLASCTATLTVVDDMGPTIEGCPADLTVDPGPLNLFYELPDYWAQGGITAVDNCTDPVTIFSQSPAPGTLLPDGVYTISICATDEYGNEGCCTFELTVESILGTDDVALDNAIAMYPNPTDGQVTIANTSNIQLEKAAIYDANGRLVQQVDLRGMTTERTFNVSSLASGVYMVQIQSESAQTVKRLIRR